MDNLNRKRKADDIIIEESDLQEIETKALKQKDDEHRKYTFNEYCCMANLI